MSKLFLVQSAHAMDPEGLAYYVSALNLELTEEEEMQVGHGWWVGDTWPDPVRAWVQDPVPARL